MLSRVGGRCTGIGAAVLAVALLLTGCSDAEDPEGGATAGPTGGEVVPTESAEPTTSETSEEPADPVPAPSPFPKPERPDAMDDTGEQGAIAAAQYFFKLYNHAASTGEVEELLHMSHDECDFCSNAAAEFSRHYEEGTWIRGSLATLRDVSGTPTADGLAFEISFRLDVSRATVYSSDGQVATYDPIGQDGARLIMQYIDGWAVVGFYAGTESE